MKSKAKYTGGSGGGLGRLQKSRRYQDGGTIRQDSSDPTDREERGVMERLFPFESDMGKALGRKLTKPDPGKPSTRPDDKRPDNPRKPGGGQ